MRSAGAGAGQLYESLTRLSIDVRSAEWCRAASTGAVKISGGNRIALGTDVSSIMAGTKGIFVALVFLLLLGCGAAPTTPTPPAPPPPPPPAPTEPAVNMAGTWTGTLESSNFPPQTVTLVVTQADSCVDGIWTSASGDWKGAISGFATADSFSGQFSLERTADGGGRCQAAGNIGGAVEGDAFKWKAGSLNAAGTCNGGLPQDLVLSLRKQ